MATTKAEQTAGKRGAAERIRELESQVIDLVEQVEMLRGRLAGGAESAARSGGGSERLAVPAAELPADYHGHMPRQVLVSLRPELRRRLMSLFVHLRAEHATTRHPRYHDETKHIDNPSHVITWLLERVTLTGGRDDAKRCNVVQSDDHEQR